MRIWECNPMRFGEELKAIREDAGLTQTELMARIHHCKLSTLKNWEQGVCLPNAAMIIEICKALKIDEFRMSTEKRWFYERNRKEITGNGI